MWGGGGAPFPLCSPLRLLLHGFRLPRSLLPEEFPGSAVGALSRDSLSLPHLVPPTHVALAYTGSKAMWNAGGR